MEKSVNASELPEMRDNRFEEQLDPTNRRPEGIPTCRSSPERAPAADNKSEHLGKRKRCSDRERSQSRTRSHGHSPHQRSLHDRKELKRQGRLRYGSPLPVLMPKSKYKYWDVAPLRFEGYAPAVYKQLRRTGQIPPTAYATTQAVTAVLGSTVTHQARRVYVGNIPYGTTEQQMLDFFNPQMHLAGFAQTPGNPILCCQINVEKSFAFLEFRAMDEATLAMTFDGIEFRGQSLKLRRPRDYQPMPGSAEHFAQQGSVSNLVRLFVKGLARYGYPTRHMAVAILRDKFSSSQVTDSPYKLFVAGIPSYFTDPHVKELLEAFGCLRSLHVVRDPATGFCKGFAFCEYMDPVITNLAIQGLDGMALGEKRLLVQYASVGPKSHAAYTNASAPVQIQVPGLDFTQGMGAATEILVLMNMILELELVNEEEYEDIMDDVKEECGKYGKVLGVEIPRPIEGVDVPGCGKVFVEYASVKECIKAQQNLSGRKFANRVVITSYYDLDKYHRRQF